MGSSHKLCFLFPGFVSGSPCPLLWGSSAGSAFTATFSAKFLDSEFRKTTVWDSRTNFCMKRQRKVLLLVGEIEERATVKRSREQSKSKSNQIIHTLKMSLDSNCLAY